MSKDQAEARQPIFDEAGVSRVEGGDNLYTSLSNLDVSDLLSEGEIEGLVSGEYHFAGNIGETGYQTYTFKPYVALDKDGSCSRELGYLRSVYWNETPVVDKNGFYNFQEVNLEWTEGTPQGKLPALNPNLPNDKNLKGEDGFELTLFRNIGERLFGPSIELGEGKTPGYYSKGQGGGGGGSSSWYGAAFGLLGAEVADKPALVGAGSLLLPDDGSSSGSTPGSTESTANSPIILGDIDRNAKIYTVSNKECVAVRVNIKVTKLLENIQDDQKDNIKEARGDEDHKGFFAQPEDTMKDGRQQPYGGGDMRARKIKYQIYTRPIFDTKNLKGRQGGSRTDNFDEDLFVPWPKKPAVEEEIFGRIEEPYVRSVEITFKSTERDGARKDYFLGWEIKIVRLTPDSFHTFLKNDSYVDSIIEVYDSKLRYPYCAMVYSKYSAEFFSRIPSRHYDAKLLKVKVPNNYNPLLRNYDESLGFWDGCFQAKKEWTNNPAWCFYDLLTNSRYGLGDYIDSRFVDKWTLYDIAKYCDVLVSDGKGGLEPRFTLNHIITSREEAYKVVNDLASAFRSIAYYAFGNIYVSQDRPKDPIYHFNTSNAIDGLFTYTSSAKKARHTVAIVRYSDKNNLYKPTISYIEDQVGVQRYGIREIETSAIGCTSEAQAKRFGEWILKSEILETESISFSAGQEGMYIRPGDVISVYDEFRNDKKMAGRTLQVQKFGSGIIPSGAIPSNINPPPSSIHPETNDYYVTGNSIIIDKAIDFTADKEYKLDILTPAGYLEPTQITPPDCEETITTTEVEETQETKKESYSTRLNFFDVKEGFFSFNTFTGPLPEQRGDFATLTAGGDGHSFINEHTVTVDSSRSQMEFLFQPFRDGSTNSSPFMQRFEVSYEAGGKTYYLPLGDTGHSDENPQQVTITDQTLAEGGEYVTNVSKLFQFREVSDESYSEGNLVKFSFYWGSGYLSSTEYGGRKVHHGEIINETFSHERRHGDIFKCLKFYADGNGTADEAAAATRELKFIRGYNPKFLRTDGDVAAHGLGLEERQPSGPLRHYEGKTANRFIAFEKPAGITSLTIRVFSPINGTSTYDNNSAVTNVYRIGLRKTHEWTAGTEKRTIENITVKSTNTDKSLTSADVSEIRRSQIQTIYFSGFQAVTHTGNFSSDYSIGGSGIVTQIFTDTQTQGQLDFDNYVITGYNAASVIGELSDDENEYSSDYENISGADLVWSIEPRTNDMTLNRDYTLDPEFASGHAQQYKVINVNENENKYDIIALEHTPIKFDNLGEGDDGGGGGTVDPGPGGPAENPTLEEEDPIKPGPDTEYPYDPIPGEDGACCAEEGSVKTCYNDWKRSQCEELDEELKPGGGTTFHKDKTCDEIDCKPPIVVPVIPRKPIIPPEENIEQFINLNFKIAADFTSISHFGGNDTNNYKLKMFTDAEAHENGLMGINKEEDLRVALGNYYDHLSCINLSPSCADQNLEQYDLESYPSEEGCEGFNNVLECCYAEQYAEKVKQYGSNFVICKKAIFDGVTDLDRFRWLTDDECSRVKKKCKDC